MKNKKLCCRIYPVVLIFISTAITLLFRFLGENSQNFFAIANKDELFNLLGIVLFVALVPIGLFYYLVEKEKYENKARQLAILGFLPALIILSVIYF